MLISETVKMRWNSKNKKWYEEKGYVFTKWKDEFDVKVEDLPDNSDKLVKFKCDYCDTEFDRKWVYYNRNIKRCNTILKDCCENENCKCEKIKESNLINYGVTSTAKLDSVQVKIKETNMNKYGSGCYLQTDEFKYKYKNIMQEKYGVDNAFQAEEVKEKIKEYNLNKYGVEYYSQTNEYKEKYKNTCMDKYGVENIFHNKDIQKQIENTMIKKYGVRKALESKEILDNMSNNIMKKYGVENISQIDDVKIKKAETFYKNGTIATSNQQRYIWSLIGGELNYSCNTPSLDIAFPEDKIYIEINGSGHDLPVKTGWMTQEQFDDKERRRYYYLKKDGWKGVFINTPYDYLPIDDVIIDEINKAKDWFKINENGHSHYNIDIGKIVNDINYGKLRKIKKEDLDKFEEVI